MNAKLISLAVLVVATCLLCWVLHKTISVTLKAKLEEMTLEATASAKYRHLALALIQSTLDGVLNRGIKYGVFARTLLVSTLFLVMSLGLIGVLTNSVVGLNKSPWQSYDDILEDLKTSADNRRVDVLSPSAAEERAAIREHKERLLLAKTPYWKYLYSLVAVVLVLTINSCCFFLSSLATRYLLKEYVSAPSTTHKIGLAIIIGIVCVTLANLSLFLVGTVHNPLVWLTLILGEYVSVGVIALLVFGSNLFALFVSDPWLKAFLIAPLLPIVCLTFLIVPAHCAELYGKIKEESLRVTARVAFERLGSNAIAILISLMILASMFATLKILI